MLGYLDNYQFKGSNCGAVGSILEHMIVKDKAQRMNLQEVETEFMKMVQ